MNLAATMSLQAGAFLGPLQQARGNLSGVIGEIGKLHVATERMTGDLKTQAQALGDHMRETTRQIYLMRVEAANAHRAVSGAGASAGGSLFGGMGGQLAGALKQLSGIGAVMAAFAGSKEIVSGVMEQFDKGHELERLARVTGESVKNLVILQKAFGAAGIESGDLGQKIAMLQRSLGGVNEMGEPTAKVFERIALSVDDLRRLSVPQQLAAIGEKLRELPTAAERTSVAMGIFGRSGAEMIALLTDPDALATATAKHAQLGRVFEENAKRFSDISKSYRSLKGEVSGTFTGIASAMSGPLAGALNGMKTALRGLRLLMMDLTGNGERPEDLDLGGGLSAQMRRTAPSAAAPAAPPAFDWAKAVASIDKSAFDFRNLLDAITARNPLSSPEQIEAAITSQARRAFSATAFMGDSPGTIEGMVGKLGAEMERLDRLQDKNGAPDLNAEKMERLLAALQKIVPLQEELNRLRADRVNSALTDFFGDMDKKKDPAPLGGMKAIEPFTDRLARIGGFIGLGGPSQDFARRTSDNTSLTAKATQMMVELMKRNTASGGQSLWL